MSVYVHSMYSDDRRHSRHDHLHNRGAGLFRVSYQLTLHMHVSSLHLLAVDNIVLSTSFITLHEMLFDIEHSALLP